MKYVIKINGQYVSVTGDVVTSQRDALKVESDVAPRIVRLRSAIDRAETIARQNAASESLD